MKTVDFSSSAIGGISLAIRTILSGMCSRIDVSKDIKVYSCGSNVIRIDLKVKENDK